MRIMSTLGIMPGSGCHYNSDGYQFMTNLLSPMIEKDHYGLTTQGPITAPNLLSAWYSNTNKTQITLEFDQAMAPWDNISNRHLYLDGIPGRVSSGSTSNNRITLQLNSPSSATQMTYLKGKSSQWGGGRAQPEIIYGANGIAALTFADVSIASNQPISYQIWADSPSQGLISGLNDAPNDDPDRDSVSNLLEMILGGDPLKESSSILPTISADNVLTFQRHQRPIDGQLTQFFEYSNDLETWSSVEIPVTSAGNIEVTPQTNFDLISINLPDIGQPSFFRLRVTE